MSDISIEYKEIGRDKIEHLNKVLSGVKNGAFRAAYSALQRASKSGQTQAGRFASATYAITKQEFMNNSRVVTRSTSSESMAKIEVQYKGYGLTLLSFKFGFSKKGRPTAQVMRGGSAQTFERAFAANIWGHMGVYERLGPERFPLEEIYGPSTAHMMGNEEVIKAVDEQITDTFEKRLDHEITRLLNGWGS